MKACKYIFGIPILFFSVLFLLCVILNFWGQQLYLPPFGSDEVRTISVCAIIMLGLIWLAVFWCVRSKNGYTLAAKLICILPVLAFVVYCMLVSYAFSSTGSYTRYDSPDGKHGLVCKDESFLMAEHGTVYVMTSPVTMKKVADLRTPFYAPPHTILWQDTCAQLVIGEEIVEIPYS